MILYLSGRITSDPDYKRKFDAAETRLKDEGHIVLNPAVLPKGLKLYANYMQIGYSMLLAADGIVMLPGWKWSRGARLELKWAIERGKKVFFGTENVQEKGDRKQETGWPVQDEEPKVKFRHGVYGKEAPAGLNAEKILDGWQLAGFSADRCVVCGEIVPEGYQVCLYCREMYRNKNGGSGRGRQDED